MPEISLNSTIIGWAANVGHRIVRTAQSLNTSELITISGTFSAKGANISAVGRGKVGAFQYGVKERAFDFTFTVPEGGFKPSLQARAIAMEKEGGVVFRARSYNKQSGQTITRKGFFSEALRRHLTKHDVSVLARGVAGVAASTVTRELKSASGNTLTVTIK